MKMPLSQFYWLSVFFSDQIFEGDHSNFKWLIIFFNDIYNCISIILSQYGKLFCIILNKYSQYINTNIV